MAAAELAADTTMTPGRCRGALDLRLVAGPLGGLILGTGLGIALELVDRGLFISAAPHPTLHPTAEAIASIFESNLRVLAVPLLLTAFRFDRTAAARTAGDLIIAVVLAANTLHIGVAIGRWQTRLLPYLPHLPLEYTAVALATAAWLSARQTSQRQDIQVTRVYAASATVLLLAAAAVEVLLTPHAR